MADYFSPLVQSGAAGTPASGDPGWNGPLGLKLLQWLRENPGGIAGAPPRNFYPQAAAPPPEPSEMTMPPTVLPEGSAPGATAAPVIGGASSRVLASLANPRPIQPLGPGGPDTQQLGINLLGPPSGEYADLRNRLSPAPVAAPAPMPMPQPQPTPPAAAVAAPTGAGIQGNIDELRANPLFQYAPPASVKPDFNDNLIRFGLAAMAAGGKPGSTTLGALGEAGTSTFDTNSKAAQSDFDNALALRKVAIAGQNQISQAYERLDALKQRSVDTRLSIEQRAEAARLHADLQAQIAGMNAGSRADTLALGRDTLTERQRANDMADRTRTDNAADRAARTAETANKDAADFYGRRRDTMMKSAPLGTLTEEQEAQLMSQAAQAHPNSNYAREWATTKAGYLDQVRAGLAANPNNQAMRQKAFDKLRSLGINPREL